MHGNMKRAAVAAVAEPNLAKTPKCCVGGKKNAPGIIYALFSVAET